MVLLGGITMQQSRSLISNLFPLLAVPVALGIAVTVHGATELARVNSKVITLEEFNTKYRDSMRFFRAKTPTKKNVLDEIINRDLGIAEAKKIGLDKDPEVVERINTVLFHAFVDKQLASKFDSIKISEKDAREYYKKNPEIRTSHIFVSVRFDANPAQEREALTKITRIKKALDEALKSGKATFAEVAVAESEGVAAAAGGDIDYQTKDKLDPIYYQSAVALGKVGNVSGIVRSQYGYHIIKLTGKKEYTEVDPGVVRRLVFEEKRSEIYDDYMASLRARSQVSVNYNLLSEKKTAEAPRADTKKN